MARICTVLATYNGEKYLPEMLDSLMAQSRQPDSIIVVDDGSRDSTLKILENYKNALPLHIEALPQNTGHRAAFSHALALASAQTQPDDLIALADQDDVWLPHKLEILEREIETKKAALVFGDAEVVDARGNKTHGSWRALAHIQKDLPFTAQLAGTNPVTGCLSLFRAGILEGALPIPPAVGVHDAWIALLAARRGGIQSIDAPVIQYRLHDANAVGTGTHYSFGETCERQIAWMRLLETCRDLLQLQPEEDAFVRTLTRYWERRPKKAFLLGFAPFFCKNRRALFPDPHGRFAKVLFSLLGAPAVHIIFGKKK